MKGRLEHYRQEDVRRGSLAQINCVFCLDASSKTSAGLSGTGINVKSGETTAVYDDADSMAGSETIARTPEVDRDLVDLMGLKK